jgi:hypothetical protein
MDVVYLDVRGRLVEKLESDGGGVRHVLYSVPAGLGCARAVTRTSVCMSTSILMSRLHSRSVRARRVVDGPGDVSPPEVRDVR